MRYARSPHLLLVGTTLVVSCSSFDVAAPASTTPAIQFAYFYEIHPTMRAEVTVE